MMWPSKVFAAVEQRAHSIPKASREGPRPFSSAISMANAKHAFDDARHDVRIGKDEPLRTKSGTKVAWVWRGLEVTSIFAAITLSNIALVKLVDALLDAVHH
jgi:hypothetical protein